MTINSDKELSFIGHLIELRDKLIKSVIAILVVFVCLFPFADEVYTFIANPILKVLPSEGNIIAIGVISPFLTPLKMALIFAVYITMPFLLYQYGHLLRPLYTNMKRK